MLRVSLLGEQSVVDDAADAVLVRSSRAAALIAFLVVHAGHSQARQRIAGLFWPDSTDAQALTNLRRELHHLRQVFGPGSSLVVTPTELCWCDTATSRVDVRVFRLEHRAAQSAAADDDADGVLVHAGAAFAEYGGELLPGVYDDWLTEARGELEAECVQLCDLLCAARTQAGDLAGAVSAARRRIALRPLEESGYRTLMELQVAKGDRAAAISTYHHCASVLEREVGVLPDHPTRAVLQRVMDRLQPSGAPPAPPGGGPGRSGSAATELVGRADEVARLDGLWRAAAAGRPGVVLIRGGAGVGKTRLVAEIAQRAQLQGAVVAGTRCFDTSGRLTLAPVADWLRNPTVSAAAATLAPVWRAEVDRLIPPRTASGHRAAGTRAVVDAWQRHRFFEGLARALLAAGRPTLLILDNLQWCDQETLAVLSFLLALAGDSPLLVAATLRDDDLQDERAAVDWTARMRAAGRLAELTLSPLPVEQTARLAEAASGRALRAGDAELLQATTGGFPLYIVEAARAGLDLDRAARPGGDLTAVLRDRLKQASGTAQEVAGLAAAVGADFSLDLLTEASDLGPAAVAQAVDELWRRRIMREFDDGYDFSHDLLREAAYAQVSPPKRWLLHRRIAQGLELLHPEDSDLVSAHLAEQYDRGGRPDRAAAYYGRAADRAAEMFAHAEAIRLHEKALSIIRAMPPGTDRDRQELARLEALAAPLNARYGYSSPELQRTLEESIALAETLNRTDSLVTALVGLWTSRFVQGRTSDGYRTAHRALSLAGSGSPRSGPAHFAVGGSAVSLGRAAEAVHHLELAARLTGGAALLTVGTRPDVHGTAWLAHAHWLLGHEEQTLEACRDAIALARTIGHPYSLAVALAYGAITHQLCRNPGEVHRTTEELSELCRRYSFAYYREWSVILGGWARPDASGIAQARQGIENLRSAGSFARMPYWLCLLADLSARAGRPGGARASLDAAIVTARAHDDMWWLPEATRMRAAYDDPHAAVERLDAAARLAHAQGSIALVRRCRDDLEARGRRLRLPAEPVG